MRIKLPLTQIQYLREVPGFRSAGHICSKIVVCEIDCIITVLVSSCEGHMTMCEGHMTMCEGHLTMCEGHMTVCESHMTMYVHHGCSVIYSADYACIVLITIVVANQKNFRLLGTTSSAYWKVPRL